MQYRQKWIAVNINNRITITSPSLYHQLLLRVFYILKRTHCLTILKRTHWLTVFIFRTSYKV